MGRYKRIQAIFMAFFLLVATFITPVAPIYADAGLDGGEVQAAQQEEQGEPLDGNDGGEPESNGETPSELEEEQEQETNPVEDESSEPGDESKDTDQGEPSEEGNNPEKEQIEDEPAEGSEEGIESDSDEEDKDIEEEELSFELMNTEAIAITENLIKDVELTLVNGAPLPNPMPNPSEEVLDLMIRYEFELDNGHGYGEGSTYTFNLPNVFKVHNGASGVLESPSGTNYGTWQLSADGTVVLTFNEEIANGSDFSGWVEFRTEIREDLTGDLDQIIKIPIKGGATKDIPIHFESKIKELSIDKRGSVNKNYNADRIDWEIDFNKALTTINNAELNDPMGANQSFVAGSIEIYELSVQLNGSVTEGAEVTSQFDTTFPINFGSIDKAYRVKFKADITDGEATQYQNIATLNADGTELPAEATVGTTRGEPLAKRSSAYDGSTQTIEWEVKYNYNEKTIAAGDAKLTDTFGTNQKLVYDSQPTDGFTVLEIDIDPNTGAEVGNGTPFINYTVTETSTGFEIQFGQQINRAYKIIYQTEAVNRVETGDTISNSITANGNTKTGNREIHQQIFNKYHHHNSTDYQLKTTEWGITINGDRHTMHDVVFTDTLPKGLTLDEIALSSSGGAITEGTHYEYEYDESTGEIKIDFTGGPLNPLTETITITYKTLFDFNEMEAGKTSFINDATLTWIPDGETDEKSMEDSAEFKPNNNTQLNGSKGGSYNATKKEITWNIGVNYNYRTISEAIVEDYIKGNQNFDIETIVVHNMEIASGGGWQTTGAPLIKGTDYTVEAITDSDDDPGFKLTFADEITTPYQISYTTDVKGQVVEKEYTNTAVLKAGATEFPLSAKVSVGPSTDRYAGKGATQDSNNPRILHWTVTINTTQSTIADAVLTDTPSADQSILEESFKLYGTKVAENGTVTKDSNNELVVGTDYTLEFKENDNGDAFFELSFTDEIDTAYILEYDTFVLATDRTNVTNDAELNGTAIEGEDTKKSHVHQFRITVGDGGAVSRLGALEVTKVDAADGTTPLEGAEFTLYDETGESVLKRLTTGADGKVTFEKLLFGDYILKETKAPEGYASGIESQGRTVTIDKEVQSSSDEINKLTIENKELNHAVKLIKQNSNHPDIDERFLAGAEFSLYDEDGNIVEKDGEKQEGLTTDEIGEIVVNELEPGNYYFVETKAPEGYQLDTTEYHFTIDVVQTDVIEVIVENKPIAVTLEKIRTGNPNIKLRGAEFKLYEKDGTPVTYIVQNDNGDDVTTDIYVTNEDGEIVINDLTAGDYYFVETKAPAGHRLDSTPIEFTVEEGKPTFVLAENRRRSSGGGGGTPPDPTDPENPDPEDPEKPVDPEDPDKPVDPEDPNPEDPENPTDPGKPGDPSNPSNPGQPGDPSNPSNPGKPGNAGDSNDPNNPGNVQDSTDGKGGNASGQPNNRSEQNGSNGHVKGENTLPNTATTMFNYGLAGVIILLIGLFLLRRRKAGQS